MQHGTSPFSEGSPSRSFIDSNPLSPAVKSPQRRLKTMEDMRAFEVTKIRKDLINFLWDINNAVRGVACSPDVETDLAEANRIYHTGAVQHLVDLVAAITSLAAECPPVDQKSRFGNCSFQTFYDLVKSRSADLLGPIVETCLRQSSEKLKQQQLNSAAALTEEFKVYLVESFGNRSRIDYGTGHELNFVIFLYCLTQAGFFETSPPEGEAATPNESSDPLQPPGGLRAAFKFLVLVVFRKYVALMRKLQNVYILEPAGSRGVWGLDDFHFLPYYWGAAQLDCAVGDVEIKPSESCTPHVVFANADRFLYLDAVREILVVKKSSPLGECAPVLYSLTNVASWRKVNSGMLKMYEAEVLGKLPVVQHLTFGKLFPFT